MACLNDTSIGCGAPGLSRVRSIETCGPVPDSDLVEIVRVTHPWVLNWCFDLLLNVVIARFFSFC